MVTGKNKEEFQKWYIEEFCNGFSFMLYSDEIKLFNSLHFEMQIGVLLAYYESKGIYVDIVSYGNQSYWMPIVEYILESEHKTRNEAYTEALKKADKLSNQLNK